MFSILLNLGILSAMKESLDTEKVDDGLLTYSFRQFRVHLNYEAGFSQVPSLISASSTL